METFPGKQNSWAAAYVHVSSLGLPLGKAFGAYLLNTCSVGRTMIGSDDAQMKMGTAPTLKKFLV